MIWGQRWIRENGACAPWRGAPHRMRRPAAFIGRSSLNPRPRRRCDPVGPDCCSREGGQPASQTGRRGMPKPAGGRRRRRETGPGRSPHRGYPGDRRRRDDPRRADPAADISTLASRSRRASSRPCARAASRSTAPLRSSPGSRWETRAIRRRLDGPPESDIWSVAILDSDPAATTLARCLDDGVTVAYGRGHETRWLTSTPSTPGSRPTWASSVGRHCHPERGIAERVGMVCGRRVTGLNDLRSRNELVGRYGKHTSSSEERAGQPGVDRPPPVTMSGTPGADGKRKKAGTVALLMRAL